MSKHTVDYNASQDYKTYKLLGAVLVALGGIGVLGAFQADVYRSWHWLLIMFLFLVSIGLGNLFLIALEYLVNANWSTPIRRISESLSGVLVPAAGIALVMLAFGSHKLFHHWIEPPDAIVQGKVSYLNMQFFTIRVILCFGAWLLFRALFLKNSRAQDKDGDQVYTRNNVKYSTVFMLVFAISISVAAMDWIMSLDPHWFSTMFGVYYFAGTLVCAVSVLTLFTIHLREKGYLPGVSRDTYYSLGLMMFAFNTFWAYIAFSQFMLIWYANLPEETLWFIKRWEGGWMYVTCALMIFHFVLPFFLLLSRTVKTIPSYLAFMARWLILAHILDLYWLVMPNYSPKAGASVFGLVDISFIVLAIGLIMLWFHKECSKANLMPIKDPKLQMGLEFKL